MWSGIKTYLVSSALVVFILGATKLAAMPFRGAWIATVANIDWPSAVYDVTQDSVSAQGYSEAQQAEMLWILDSLKSIGINAIIFQVRPTADALYMSELEPWSHWLTGRQGIWNDSATQYDPLAFVVDEAHMRGMEVHAWVNPFRVNIATMDTSVLCSSHLMRRQPDWFWQYGKQWYFDPANDECREWLCMVVEDIVCRYAIDAIHMDDYFYPYPIGKTPLPDSKDYETNPRGFEDIRDWRRDNVNKTIYALSQTIRQTREGVEFGISPFGVWRNADVAHSADSNVPNWGDSLPTGSRTMAGMTNYDDLYADVLLWMREGWIDYVVPQLYWEIGKKVADYEELAHWWAAHHYDCKLYIGMAPYRLGGAREAKAWKEGNEIIRQMQMNRAIEGIDGECFYSTRPLLKNPKNICDSIKRIYVNEKDPTK